jgi:FixJ family two-component response regulator
MAGGCHFSLRLVPLSRRISTVIVVEDDVDARRTLARVLETAGYDAQMFASAEEYLAAPPPPSPMGLLLDVHLGGMSGLELQRRLRAAGSNIPIIIITASDDGRSREQAERLGCVAYLLKPCGALAILDALRSIVKKDLE